MIKILFISHELTRTGAPKVFLSLLKHICQTRRDIHIDVLALDGGLLHQEFKETFPSIRVIDNNNIVYRFIDNLLSRVIGNSSYQRGRFFLDVQSRRYINKNYNLIYANTILSLPLSTGIKVKSENCRLIVHIHELKTITKLLLPEFSTYLDKIDQFIVVSDLVKHELIEEWGVSSHRIEVIHSFTEQKKIVNQNRSSSNRTLEIGSAGYAKWNKGYDLFIQVAFSFRKKYPTIPARFRWIGNIDRTESLVVEGDLKKAGLSDYVYFTGEINEPFHIYNELDVLLLTSREESFSLVSVEAGRLGKPIICFESASGIASIVEAGNCGTVVPYLDCESMADAIASYWSNNPYYQEHSNAAKKVFSEFTPELQVPKIIDVIEKNLRK